MLRLICSGVALLLLLAGCTETPTRNNDFAPLTSIQIVPADPSVAANRAIAVNTSTKLKVIGNFSGQFTRDITDQAAWSSSATTVAGFVNLQFPNRVTGLSPGTAILTATVGNVSATFNLTVTSATATSLTVTPAAPSVPIGLTTQFAASGTFSDGTTQDITFDASWASSAPNVATVGDAAANKGLAKAVAVGATTITATFEGASGTALLTVTQVVLQSITVTPANPSVLSVSTEQFAATGTFSDGSTADITGQVAWTSSQPSIATIAAGGLATTLTIGTTPIIAALNGVSGTTNLKVTGGNLTGITLAPANPKPVVNTIVPMTATGSFSNGSSRDITGLVTWSVASTSVASVTTPGGNVALLDALASTGGGTTTVTATFGSVTASTNLSVSGPLLQSLAISPTSLDLTVGTSVRFVLTATFNNGTTQDVTASADWTSGNSAIFSADNTGLAKGRVHGISAGLVNVSAAFGGITVTAPVTVRSRTIVNLTISGPPTVVLSSGNQVKFTATATYSDATTQDVTEDVAWTIDNPNVAILADSQNQPGQVIGVDTGSATLTATFGGKTESVALRVP
jgi:hypothetical protein